MANLTPDQEKRLHRIQALTGVEMVRALAAWSRLEVGTAIEHGVTSPRVMAGGDLGSLHRDVDETANDWAERLVLGMLKLADED
jgi:hypothetical protein